MAHFDFTPPSGKTRRPSSARIVAAWKKAGRPDQFTVSYGETFAKFQRVSYGGLFHGAPRWYDSGNGCRGVDRAAVVSALMTDYRARAAKNPETYR